MKAAVQAVERISYRHDWHYYRTYAKLVTSASYNTGTAVYTNSTRTVTLTGGTFPDWVGGYGTIVLNSVHYDIQTRLSGTTATLKTSSNPGADIASTTFTIYRNRYDLATDFVSLRKPVMALDNLVIEYCTVEEFLRRRNWNEGVGTAYMFTLMDNGYGREQILFWCPPGEVTTAEYEYNRRPAAPTVANESRGTIALTSASQTVTGTSTMFTQAMVGAVLRVGYDSTVPTAYDSIKPPQYEYLIASVESATSLTLAAAAEATVTKRGYVISNRVDVKDGPMFNLLMQMAMKDLRVMLRINMTNEEQGAYERTEREAKDADGQNYMGSDVARGGMFLGVAGDGRRRGSYMQN